MTAAVELIERAAAAGVSIRLGDDGKVKVRGNKAALAELVEPLRQHKEELIRWFERELIPIEIQTESYRLLTRLATPTPITAQVITKPGVCPNLATPQPWHHVDAVWRVLAKAYNAHHFNCKTCISAGQGRGLRCGTGSALWTPYQDAFDKPTTKVLP